MYVWWGRSKKKGRGYVSGGEKRKEKKNNNVMIKIQFKNQNYVPNTNFFFLIVISVVKPKLCTK